MRRFYARAASISENLPRMWQDRHKYIIYATARCIGMSRALRRFDHWTHVCYTQRREQNGAMKGSGKMKTRMNGKTVLITGASNGIGRAAALAFAEEGASLALAARKGGGCGA